jgi:hypothetical protein
MVTLASRARVKKKKKEDQTLGHVRSPLTRRVRSIENGSRTSLDLIDARCPESGYSSVESSRHLTARAIISDR